MNCGVDNITVSTYVKSQTCDIDPFSVSTAGYFDCYKFGAAEGELYWRITPGADMVGYADAKKAFEIAVAEGDTQVD